MAKRKLQVQWVEISKLKPYANNPRSRSAASVKKIAASLTSFGWRQPIVVDRDFVIVAGHGRFDAAVQLQQKKVPVVVATDLTPAQAAAYRLADNRTAEETTWNAKLLRIELSDLKKKAKSGDLKATAFDDDELAKLLAGVTVDDNGAKPVAFNATRVPKVSQPGDVWLLGTHQLAVGPQDDPHHCDRLVVRWQKMASSTAMLQANGTAFADVAKQRAHGSKA